MVEPQSNKFYNETILNIIMMNPEEFKDIIYEPEDNGIVTVTLNRPERKNAMSFLTALELKHAARNFDKDRSLKVMIVTGCEESDIFNSGGYFDPRVYQDIPEQYKKEVDLRDMASKDFGLIYWDVSKPVIFALNGPAIGGGITFPIVCGDLIYMADDAWLAMYFVKRAVVPDFATTYILPFIVGLAKAREMFYFGDHISAKEAEELGIINKAVPKDQLMDYAREQALRLIPPKGPSKSISFIKKIINQSLRDMIAEQADRENFGWKKCITSKDNKESMKALKEKRDAVFIGK